MIPAVECVGCGVDRASRGAVLSPHDAEPDGRCVHPASLKARAPAEEAQGSSGLAQVFLGASIPASPDERVDPMDTRARTSAAPPDLETAEGFAAYISDALAAGDDAVIREAFATLARKGGKSWTEGEASSPNRRPDPGSDRRSHEIPTPVKASKVAGQNPGSPLAGISAGTRASPTPRRPPRANRAARYLLPGIAMVGVLAALLTGSLNVPIPPPASRPTSGPIPLAAPQSQAPAPAPSGQINHQNESLATQRDALKAQVIALSAQVAEQTARLHGLQAQTGQAAQQLAALPGITARIAQETSTLEALQTQLKQTRQKLVTQRARSGPAHAAPSRATVAMLAPAPAPRFSAAQSMERRWRREGARLIAARGALTAGDTTAARQLIEAVQTQLVFQPVTPYNPTPQPDRNVTAGLLGQAINLLNAGRTLSALRVLDRAIAELGVGPVPGSDTQAAGSG